MLLVEVPKFTLLLHSHKQKPQQQQLPPEYVPAQDTLGHFRQLAYITHMMQFGNLCTSKYFPLEFRSI